jgi:hypothetical protein
VLGSACCFALLASLLSNWYSLFIIASYINTSSIPMAYPHPNGGILVNQVSCHGPARALHTSRQAQWTYVLIVCVIFLHAVQMQPAVMVVPSSVTPSQPAKDTRAEIKKIRNIAAASVAVNIGFLICMLGSWGTPDWLVASVTTPLLPTPILSLVASLSTVTLVMCTYLP